MQKQSKSILFDKLVAHQNVIVEPPTSQQDQYSSRGDGILNKQTRKETINSLPTTIVLIKVHETSIFTQHLP
jgi:hypothetical protein